MYMQVQTVKFHVRIVGAACVTSWGDCGEGGKGGYLRFSAGSIGVCGPGQVSGRDAIATAAASRIIVFQ